MNFSVCMSVYRGDNPRDFIAAVDSIYNRQTIRPSEIILVVDGPVSDEMEKAIGTACDMTGGAVKTVRFEKNQGHARARQAGLDNASNELCAIMDSDDIAVADRFELQLKMFDDNPELTVAGGQIAEFTGCEENTVGRRIVPCSDSEIKSYLKSRCPMNLVTVMYKKRDVVSVGGFMDWYCEEDYYLWIRLALQGYKFGNLPQNLVNVRVGNDMYQRRGGWRYFRSEAKLQKYMLQHKIISLPRYLYNVAGRFVVQVAMPNRLRGFVFQKLFRK